MFSVQSKFYYVYSLYVIHLDLILTYCLKATSQIHKTAFDNSKFLYVNGIKLLDFGPYKLLECPIGFGLSVYKNEMQLKRLT